MELFLSNQESPIRSTSDNYCVVPDKTSCSAAELEDRYLVSKKQDENCTAPEATFVLDQDGVIHHKCSKKTVCGKGTNYSRLLALLPFHMTFGRTRWPL